MRCISLIFIVLLFLASTAHAQWVPNGVAATASGDHTEQVVVVPDGAEGAIVVWSTGLDVHAPLDIRAQRFDPDGFRQWGSTGISVCAATGIQTELSAVSDGAGGVLISWTDKRNGGADIYAMRIDAIGAPASGWSVDGNVVCTSNEQQTMSRVLSLGGGASLIVWQDRRNDPSADDIYLQKLNAGGAAQYTANGIPVCTSGGIQFLPQLATDNEGGAIIAWSDTRGADVDVYAQRINFLGSTVWTNNGTIVSAAVNDQYGPQIAPDGAGGAVIVWEDYRDIGSASDIYAQRLLPNGARNWAASPDGVLVSPFGQDSLEPQIISIGASGALVAWRYDRHLPNGQSIYVARIELDSFVSPAGGRELTATGDHRDPAIAPDGAGGAVVSWRHNTGASSDIHAQRLNLHAQPIWGTGTRIVCNWTGAQSEPAVIVNPTNAIVAWLDPRSGDERPFAQRLHLDSGYWGTVDASILYLFDTPFDFGLTLDMHFAAVAQEEQGPETVERYLIFRAEGILPPGPPSSPAQVSSAGPLWTEVLEVFPDGSTEYQVEVPTTRDATGGDLANHYYIVCAEVDGVMHYSKVDSGRSWNNMGPGTGVGDTPSISGIELLRNTPNPFSGTTTIRVGMETAADVTLEVFDVAGRRVATRRFTAKTGWSDYNFDGRGADGRPLPSGVYLYRLRGAGFTSVNKMIVAR